MYRAVKCKWCGAGLLAHGRDTIMHCQSIEHESGKWTQSPKCKLKGVESYISRVVEMLKTAERRYVSNGFASYVDSRVIDKAIAMLEGKEE